MFFVIVITSIIFAVLSILNWNKMIGAGPTILIVGSIFLMGFIGVSYSNYLYDVRVYDACVDRHARLSDQYKFNNTLVLIVEREWAERQDVVKELSEAITAPFDISECGKPPEFLDGKS